MGEVLQSVTGYPLRSVPVGGVDRYVRRDYFVRYARDHGLNIHFGLGLHGPGFDKFKRDAGAIVFKVERHPEHRRVTALLVKASKMKWYGRLLRRLSTRYSQRIVYEVMPTT